MRVLVAVYSSTFNTLKVANAVKEAMGADLTQIEGQRHGMILDIAMAWLRLKTGIKPCRTDLKNYDMLILCSPTWSSSTPPAVNSYMAALQQTEGKKLGVVITMGGKGGDKVAVRMRNALEKKGMRYLDSLVFRTRDVENGAYFQKADQFVASLKSKAAMPHVVEATKQNVSRIVRMLNLLAKLVR